ncbi:MAG: hypothetical protein IPK06_05350 [Ignavibacteriae bacterium]|nr:hypothetical protein [Ignavibacteriota bacterium]
MKNLSREDFIKTSLLALGAVMVPKNFHSIDNSPNNKLDEIILEKLIYGNNNTIDKFLSEKDSPQRIQYYRNLSGILANLSAGFCHPKSKYYKSSEIISPMENTIKKLLSLQYPDGTLDSGGNRKSAPDTAFLLESLCPAAKIIKENNFPELEKINKLLDSFLIKAGEGISTGGVHTPNHRWEVSATLAKLYSLYKDEKYLQRIDEWLEEGIYIDEDGNYPERSRNYAVVENSSFITLGEILKQPRFFEIVKRNLTESFYYLEDDGELVSLNSRRQDQYAPISILKAYLEYRFMAIHENDKFLSAVTSKIELLPDFQKSILSRNLPHFMATPLLLNELPKGEELPQNYTKFFTVSNLVRIKNGDISASIFGGNDKPLIIASGRSCIPTFFTYRKKTAILDYMRMSTSFFSMGYFRSDGIKKDGNKYILHEKKEAYYYHPFPKNKLNKDGDYELTESVDGRFWSKMNFGDRPKTTMSIDSTIRIEEINDGFDLEFEITGAENVEVTIELCFKENGKLEGVSNGNNQDDFFLESGSAKYTFGNDSIEVGPGKFEHSSLYNLDGEEYSTHFGTLKGKGMHLYITGLVPFKHKLTIK